MATSKVFGSLFSVLNLEILDIFKFHLFFENFPDWNHLQNYPNITKLVADYDETVDS